MLGLLLLAIFGIASFALAIHARSPEPIIDTSVPTLQAAAIALLPQRIPVSLEGTVVLDDAPAKNTQPFLLFTEQKEGESVVKTKRLIFPTAYVCMKGDIPCAFPTEDPYPFTGGEHVWVTGVAEADLIYVETIRFL
jgi:hypothetical protein